MKHFSILFATVLGMALINQNVLAQESVSPEPDSPQRSVEEDMTLEGDADEESPVLEEGEEGEVIERGLRRFNFPRKKAPTRKSGSQIRKFRFRQDPAKNPVPATKNLRLKGRPITPPGGSSTKPPAGGETPPAKPPDLVEQPPQCVWQTSDIIDQRIDVSAQERLMHMMSRGGKERLDASAMIGAVKQGTLAGILLAPRKVVSDRGQRMTPKKGWWELIPKGQLGTCLQEPAGEPPMILYRDKNGEFSLDPSIIDHTLRTMWGQCGLPTPAPACSYLVDLHRPPPKSGSTDEHPEGYGELQVSVKGGGKALAGVKVSVSAIRKVQPGDEDEQGKGLLMVQFTNGDGVTGFLIPPVENRISVQVLGPPGFLSQTSEFGFLPKETKGMMVELEPISPSGPAS